MATFSLGAWNLPFTCSRCPFHHHSSWGRETSHVAAAPWVVGMCPFSLASQWRYLHVQSSEGSAVTLE